MNSTQAIILPVFAGAFFVSQVLDAAPLDVCRGHYYIRVTAAAAADGEMLLFIGRCC